jgi:hypothetical protein
MQFLKKNYEKILLGLVLAGLIGFLVFMLFYIGSDEQTMKNTADGLIHPTPKPLAPLDLTAESNVSTRVQAPYSLDFDTSNKVFNPMEWQKDLNNNLIPKATHIGPQFVVVTNIQPLYLVLALESVETNEFGTRYIMDIERQADKNPSHRHKQQHFMSMGDKNDVFSIVSATGAPTDPTALSVKLLDTGEVVSVSRSQPYKRVDGYLADFTYSPEKKVFHNRRVGDRVSFGGSEYEVMDITADELILSDESNQKKTSLRLSP